MTREKILAMSKKDCAGWIASHDFNSEYYLNPRMSLRDIPLDEIRGSVAEMCELGRFWDGEVLNVPTPEGDTDLFIRALVWRASGLEGPRVDLLRCVDVNGLDALRGDEGILDDVRKIVAVQARVM
jgi:hypothetical protein